MQKVITKCLSILLTIALMISVVCLTPISASALSQGEAVSWMASKSGTTIYDGGTQCVAAFNSYLRLFGFSNPISMYPVNSAYQIFNYDAPDGWQKIWGSGNYQAGDVVIWGSSIGGGHGHVGMVYSTSGTVQIFDQNWVVKNACGIHILSQEGAIRGVFRPPFSVNPFPGPEDDSWNVPVWKTANSDLNTYNEYGTQESNRWIDSGDNCYIEKVYQNGFAWVKYPSSASSDGWRWAYALASGFPLEKKGKDPFGVIDSVTGEQGAIHIHGWAFDEDDKNAQLNIHVYIGGGAGDPNAEGHNQTWANKERKDVNNVYGCGDYHGYDDTIVTSKTGNQAVHIYAINVGDGNNKYLGEVTVNISPDTDAPSVSDVTVSQVSSKGFRVTCRVSDPSGISKVQFPTWTSHNGQDDLGNWPVATVKGDTASLYIKASNHNNETGEYNVHIYADDNRGNQSSTSIQVSELTDTPSLINTLNYNGNSYKVFNSGMSWSEAKTWCEENGGHLATATSSSEWNVIKNLLKGFNGIRCWLGAEEINNNWQWISGESFIYQDWANNQPDCANGNEHYLGSFGDKYLDCYQWNDYTVDASDVGGFVCEYENTIEPQVEKTIYFKGHTYKIYNAVFTWDKAKEWCERNGGHLATLTSEQEWKNLKGFISSKENMNYWLGADVTSGSWKWITDEPFNYNQWGTKQPDNSGGIEKYLGSYYSSTDNSCVWNDFARDYHSIAGFVCEYEEEDTPKIISEFEYNDHIYVVYNADMNWTQAQEWCRNNDGNLATITDSSEWDAVKSHLSDNCITNCWLGANCTSGNWKWVTDESFNYSKWAEGQPDKANGTELYLGTFGFTDNYSWNDYVLSPNEIGTFLFEKEKKPTYIVGDTNGDGTINMKDIVLLQQYLNGWNVSIDASAANVNGDSNINMKDIVLLQQYLNGWPVVLK